jgi:hypothetical protein
VDGTFPGLQMVETENVPEFQLSKKLSGSPAWNDSVGLGKGRTFVHLHTASLILSPLIYRRARCGSVQSSVRLSLRLHVLTELFYKPCHLSVGTPAPGIALGGRP